MIIISSKYNGELNKMIFQYIKAGYSLKDTWYEKNLDEVLESDFVLGTSAVVKKTVYTYFAKLEK